MPSNYQVVSEMAAQKAASITNNAGEFMRFLDTAANNYKYTFKE